MFSLISSGGAIPGGDASASQKIDPAEIKNNICVPIPERQPPHIYSARRCRRISTDRALITNFGNIPLLDMIDTWNVASPSANWFEIAQRWYAFHSIRIGVDLVGFALDVGSVFSVNTHREATPGI